MASTAEKGFAGFAPSRPWSLGNVAGRLVEISCSSASAALTVTLELAREAQENREPVGWIGLIRSCFYPPDAAQNGLDLASLIVVRLNKADAIARAGEKLLRSGGFGVLILDLRKTDIPMPLQSRLNCLAQRHRTALVCLTEKPPRLFSLSSLVSLRVHAEKKRASDDSYACTLHVLRDKRRGPTWKHEALYGIQPGLHRAGCNSGLATFLGR